MKTFTGKRFGIWLQIMLIALLSLQEASAQSILQKVTNRAEQSATDKILQKTDKTVSKGMDVIFESNAQKQVPEESNRQENVQENMKPQQIQAFSKYDFVPGDTVVYSNDFATESLGELPTGWNSNGNSVVVKLDGQEAQWFRLSQKSTNFTDNKAQFGPHFTAEFDLLLQPEFKGWAQPSFSFGLLASGHEDPASNKFLNDPKGNKSFYMEISPLTNGINALLESYQKYTRYFHSPVAFNPVGKGWFGRIVHVAIQAQKERLRIWIDGEKLYDIPKALPIEGGYNQLFFQLGSSPYEDEQVGVFISNIKIAKGLPDSRNKLLNEGSFSTTGILFDSGAAVIKPESIGVLKEIATILNQQSDLKLQIVGHTDDVGSETANQQLSEQRALSVKSFLTQKLGIATDRLTCQGKGESAPVADNKTSRGKAQNRRIEFIRM